MFQSDAYWCEKCDKTHLDECDKDVATVVHSLAYRFQTLRCWIINEILAEGSGQSEEMRKKAKAILDVTQH
jgi:hypothetical protein